MTGQDAYTAVADGELTSRIAQQIDESHDELVNTTQTLVRIPSETPPSMSAPTTS